MERWHAVFGRDPEVERLHLAALGERGIDRRARQGRSPTRQATPTSTEAPDAIQQRALDRSPAEPDTLARTLAEMDAMTAMEHAGWALRRLPRPVHPEHHFVFDPAKLLFYTATCFVRVGDAERAEDYAREVIALSDGPSGVARWPRRLITARMDLGLALTQLDRPDEACHVGGLALASNSLVASNLWQASELDDKLMGDYATLPEAQGFHDRYLSARISIAGAAG